MTKHMLAVLLFLKVAWCRDLGTIATLKSDNLCPEISLICPDSSSRVSVRGTPIQGSFGLLKKCSLDGLVENTIYLLMNIENV